jgi:folylpolyglutamate synthase/dihydropteroate synthase
MADKDYTYIADKISTVANRVFCLTPNNPRALQASEYSEVYKERGIESSSHPTVKDAVLEAISNSKENGKPILCVGSLYMYAEIASAVEEALG